MTYKIVIAGFSIYNKLGKIWFFERIFLLANTSMKVVIEMLFLIFFDVDTRFAEKKLV